MYSLSIIIPVYNEEENVAKAVRDAFAFCELQNLDFEIIAVDDGSADSSGSILCSLASQLGKLKVIHHLDNRGIGISLNEALKVCSKDYIFIYDADSQYEINDLSLFFPYLRVNAPAVLGVRERTGDSSSRLFLSFIYRTISRIFFRVRANDFNCGFRAVRRDILEDITVSSKDAVYFLEQTLKLEKTLPNIIEVPIKFSPRIKGRSKICRPRRVFMASLTFLSLLIGERI